MGRGIKRHRETRRQIDGKNTQATRPLNLFIQIIYYEFVIGYFIVVLCCRYARTVVALAGACSLSPLQGPCRASITRWYYDVTSGTCETFSYGGCRGNANNFRSPESCMRYCRPLVDEKQHRSRMWYLRVLGLLR